MLFSFVLIALQQIKLSFVTQEISQSSRLLLCKWTGVVNSSHRMNSFPFWTTQAKPTNLEHNTFILGLIVLSVPEHWPSQALRIPTAAKPPQTVPYAASFVNDFSVAVSAADPGPDTDGLAEAQSGAAPTAEGKTKTPPFVLQRLWYVASDSLHSYRKKRCRNVVEQPDSGVRFPRLLRSRWDHGRGGCGRRRLFTTKFKQSETSWSISSHN